MENTRLAQLHKFLEQDPADPFLHYAIATELIKEGDDAGAEARFRTLTEQFPDYIGTYYHFGKLLERLQRPAEAEAVYRKGIAVAEAQKNGHARNELRDALEQLTGDDGEEW